MIKSFAHKGLEKFYRTGSRAGIQAIHAEKLRLILGLLAEATNIRDMNGPSLALHPLKGDKKDFWAVTVQANRRISFKFIEGSAENVDYEDYH